MSDRQTERNLHGISTVDSWNLYCYISESSLAIVKGIRAGKTPYVLTPTISYDIERFLNYHQDAQQAKYEMDNLPDIFDDNTRVEAIQLEETELLSLKKAAELFLFNILPVLSFSPTYSIPEADRESSPLADEDYEYAGSFFVFAVCKGFDSVISRGVSYPPQYSFEEWKDRMRIMSESLKKIHDGERDEHGLQLIIDDFYQLWD